MVVRINIFESATTVIIISFILVSYLVVFLCLKENKIKVAIGVILKYLICL